jgi:imidazolonepropionase-like amidohydrolase
MNKQQDLVHEAAKAYHYGLDEHKALQAVTTIPAAAIGLSHRIGRQVSKC